MVEVLPFGQIDVSVSRAGGEYVLSFGPAGSENFWPLISGTHRSAGSDSAELAHRGCYHYKPYCKELLTRRSSAVVEARLLAANLPIEQ
jgi:hypothetical protein